MSLTRVTRSSLRPARGPIRIPVTLAKLGLPRRVALPVDGVTAELFTRGPKPLLSLSRATTLPSGRQTLDLEGFGPLLSVLVVRSRILVAWPAAGTGVP